MVNDWNIIAEDAVIDSMTGEVPCCLCRETSYRLHLPLLEALDLSNSYTQIMEIINRIIKLKKREKCPTEWVYSCKGKRMSFIWLINR